MKTIPTKFFLVVAALTFCFFPAGAQIQNINDLSKMSLEELLSIEVSSAAKVSQRPLEAPGIVSVWTVAQIRQYGWQNLNDVLYHQPGFSPSKDYDRKTVTARGVFEGWNNNHLLLLIDGVPFNDNLYGTAFTWDITPLTFLQSVEIIRGPGSALYGSNATNGVIAVNTINTPAEGIAIAGGNFSMGNRGSRIFEAYSGVGREKFSAVMAFSANMTRGNEYRSYDGSGRQEGGGLKQFTVNDNRNSHYLFLKLDGRSTFEGFQLQYHEQYWDYETGHGWLWQIPDLDESMRENRRLAVLRYKTSKTQLNQEYVVRYQHHQVDWNMRFFPDSTPSYDNGVSEYLKTGAQDVFFRAQLTFPMAHSASVIVATENDIFWYGGDKSHYSNIDLNSTYAANPGNQFSPAGPWLGWIKDNPVYQMGFFGQFASGKMLGNKLAATVGARYDRQSFRFNDLAAPGIPKESKSFSQFSPRLGLVFLVNNDFSLKALAGRAFRAPSPTELFGANTYTLASNLRNLKPETITTYELGADVMLKKNLNWRINSYHTKFENQIAYSVANANLSTNIYTLTTWGVETEFLFEWQKFSGFVNYAFCKRLDEKILDNTITASKSKLTWAPANTTNFGIKWLQDAWSTSLTGHFQGQVDRRTSDLTNATANSLRGNAVKTWFSLDGKVLYQWTENVEVGIEGQNLLNGKNKLIKNIAYPFDYRGEPRLLRAVLSCKF